MKKFEIFLVSPSTADKVSKCQRKREKIQYNQTHAFEYLVGAALVLCYTKASAGRANEAWEDFQMRYNYNKLWKLLIDKKMSRTAMRKQAGISTNILAKMGKDEPISMKSLEKICISLKCELDDIVEIFDESLPLNYNYDNYDVSDATIRNWSKLNTEPSKKLIARANKRKSQKRILPLEYIHNKNNAAFVQYILDCIDSNRLNIDSVLLTLGIHLLKQAGLYNRKHVAAVLNDYSNITVIDGIIANEIPNDEFDILGVIYQSYLQEGKKNTIGSYYTPEKIVQNMTASFDFSNGALFFDPCCGSGAFLIAVNADNPCQLFGIDNDRIAVMISKINLLLKYPNVEFMPQVYCVDYLLSNSLLESNDIFEKKFDYIATNPPWGAMSRNYSSLHEITSKETFSYFFVKAFGQLKPQGTIRFLFPKSILNVKVHKDIRKFILNTAKLERITIYDEMFSGVMTKYVDIECGNNANKEYFLLLKDNCQRSVEFKTVYETQNLIFNFMSAEDISIVKIFKDKGKYSLENSIWALGVVTGNNKEKIHTECLEGMEKIYTGKEIQPYVLKPANKYILYNRNDLQQVAREEIYRAPEKLVYKFISNKLVFAYDDSSSLFLNSANILIPSIPSMSVKTVMAFLNSALFQFIYLKLFGEVKILKGNLIELQFPEITTEQNNDLTLLVEYVLNGDPSKTALIDEYIFSIYSLSYEQVAYIRRTTNGKDD